MALKFTINTQSQDNVKKQNINFKAESIETKSDFYRQLGKLSYINSLASTFLAFATWKHGLGLEWSRILGRDGAELVNKGSSTLIIVSLIASGLFVLGGTWLGKKSEK